MGLTKDDFYKDSADQGLWFYKCRDLLEKEVDEILLNQKIVEEARLAVKTCPLGLCAYCAGLRLVLEAYPWK